MQPIDITLIIILAFGAYKGYRKGLFMEIVTIIALFLAIVMSFSFLGLGVQLLSGFIAGAEAWLPYFAFFLIFLISIAVIHLVGKGIKQFMDLTLLGSLDDLAGALVGILKWSLAISLILWFFTSFGAELPKQFTEDSVLYPVIAGFAPTMVSFFSDFLPAIDFMLDELLDSKSV